MSIKCFAKCILISSWGVMREVLDLIFLIGYVRYISIKMLCKPQNINSIWLSNSFNLSAHDWSQRKFVFKVVISSMITVVICLILSPGNCIRWLLRIHAMDWPTDLRSDETLFVNLHSTKTCQDTHIEHIFFWVTQFRVSKPDLSKLVRKILTA